MCMFVYFGRLIVVPIRQDTRTHTHTHPSHISWSKHTIPASINNPTAWFNNNVALKQTALDTHTLIHTHTCTAYIHICTRTHMHTHNIIQEKKSVFCIPLYMCMHMNYTLIQAHMYNVYCIYSLFLQPRPTIKSYTVQGGQPNDQHHM